jgi:uncharacterized protein
MTIVADEPAVAALWRYPVKSMQGEELVASEVTTAGLLGDRQFAVVDLATGKVAGAKNPRKWPGFLQFRAGYVSPPAAGAALPPVRVTLPDGTSVTSDDGDLPKLLSGALGRDVEFAGTAAFSGGAGDCGAASGAARAEDYQPHSGDVVDWELPAGTFFDCAPVHLVTTATLDRLRLLYPAGRFEPRRFRPNIIVATGPGVSGFVENDWVGRVVAIGDRVRLRVFMATGRCVMTTLAQFDLPRDSRILRTAAQHNDAAVGVYAEVVSGGLVRRGDVVTVLLRRWRARRWAEAASPPRRRGQVGVARGAPLSSCCYQSRSKLGRGRRRGHTSSGKTSLGAFRMDKQGETGRKTSLTRPKTQTSSDWPRSRGRLSRLRPRTPHLGRPRPRACCRMQAVFRMLRFSLRNGERTVCRLRIRPG